ncbi:hypothetical protein ZWY2020_057333 [Hordeum vulgare]|nr:hypothetical protein ZWY2020_057333 [Hordeum vulgare]
MLGSTTGTVALAPLRLQRVPGLPEGTESTTEVSADGVELLKVTFDGTRPQVVALLAELRLDALMFNYVTPWGHRALGAARHQDVLRDGSPLHRLPRHPARQAGARHGPGRAGAATGRTRGAVG